MARPSVTLVDLGLGNLRSVARAFERCGNAVRITSRPEDARRAELLLVPGQGAFRDCARALSTGLGDALRDAIAQGTPYVGICLGMQVLFESSEEAPNAPGLAILKGEVKRFAADLCDAATHERLKVPHMGWNEVRSRHGLLPPVGWFYFVHSYYCAPADPSSILGRVDYGGPFAAAIARDNVFGCQFHPEKSHRDGLAVIERLGRGLPWS